MMGVLFDTNILLDIALSRKPFAESSFAAFQAVRASGGRPLVAPHSLATFYYIVAQSKGKTVANTATRDLIATAKIACFEHETALGALNLEIPDFEDAMVAAVALREEAQLILTRNGSDFARSPVPCQTPEEFLSRRRTGSG